MLREPLNVNSPIIHSHPNPEPSENKSIIQTTPILQFFFQITLPLFPQYTLNQSDSNPQPRHFVDEHVLIPTLHWTAYYNFTNPLALPLSNSTIDIERNKDELFRLNTALTLRQFTYVGYKKLLKTFTAPRANEYSIKFYDHNIIRSNQDQFLDDDKFANPQITEKFFY